MSWATVVAARLRGLFGRQQRECELDDEVQFHLEMQVEDNVKAGMDPAAARHAAMRSFGGVESMKESYRDRRAFGLVEATVQDLRYALRTLGRSPGFTITAVAVLALAICATTVMFSVLNTVLLRPLPYQSPERLAMLWTEDPAQQLHEGRSALWDVQQWRSQTQSFADFATFDTVGTTLTGEDGAEQIVCASISSNLLPILGVRPVLGRGFSSEEAKERQRVVLISHRFWQARFGGSRGALGATLVLNGFPNQIIGVLPAGFRAAKLDADVWESHPSDQNVRGSETWFVLGRLRPAVAFEQAQQEMNAIAHRLKDQLPAGERNRGISVVPLSRYMVGRQPRLALWILGGAVFCVFLIAAANVTSLSLARSAARVREMALRAALGASAGRIVRQLLTEGLVLTSISGVAGTLLASAAMSLIRAFGPSNLSRLNEIGLDLRVLGWAMAISMLAGILVGLAPAIAALRHNLRPSGGEGGRSVAGGVGIRRIRGALVVADFGLAIVLLAGAGLLIRSWWNVTNIDPGFRSERVIMMDLTAPPAANAPAQRANFYDRVLEQVQAIPGVERAGIADDLFSENPREHILTVDRDGAPVFERLPLTIDQVSTDLFKTLGTPLRHGRFFSVGDRPGAPLVAIVNEAMARRYWPRKNPLGRRFRLGSRESGGPWHTVVGVVADMRRQGPEREALPQIFEPLAQNPSSSHVNLLVQTTSADPLALAGALRAAVRGVDKYALVYDATPLDERLGTYLAQRRFHVSLLAGFSVVALLMAAVGIFGLIQYSVATRTQEIGIRMALGADAGKVFRLILGEGMKLTLAGLLLGLLGALMLGQTGSSLLFGVTTTDPATFVAVSLLLIAVALVACCLPARRAMRISPITALRQG